MILLLACSAAEDVKTPEQGEETSEETAIDTRVLGPEGTSAVWTPILTEDDRLTDPRDLGFDPEGRLWVANREDDHTFIVTNPGTDDAVVDRRIDGYAMHFMEEVAALAFETPAGAGAFGNEFASCGDSRNTYNGDYRPNDFMGPTLWTTNLDIFAVQNPEGLGSHLDMQHQAPNCVGIAWEKDNVYWVFDGLNNAIVRNDFAKDHGVGQDDHSDGIIYRLSEPEVARVEDAPGHMVFDPVSALLYVADTGNDRILAIDTTSGTRGKDLRGEMELVELFASWEDVVWSEVVTDLDHPGGLALVGGHLIVGEWGSGMLYEYDLDGTLLSSLDTGLGPEVLHGVELGPDGALWVAELATPSVSRLTFE